MIYVSFLKSPKGEKQCCEKCKKEVISLIASNKYKGYSHISSCCHAKTYFLVFEESKKSEVK